MLRLEAARWKVEAGAFEFWCIFRISCPATLTPGTAEPSRLRTPTRLFCCAFRAKHLMVLVEKTCFFAQLRLSCPVRPWGTGRLCEDLVQTAMHIRIDYFFARFVPYSDSPFPLRLLRGLAAICRTFSGWLHHHNRILLRPYSQLEMAVS